MRKRSPQTFECLLSCELSSSQTSTTTPSMASGPDEKREMHQGLLERLPQSEPQLIWQGETWEFPLLLKCCSPLMCSTWKWQITTNRIDLKHGFCESSEDIFDLRRVEDIHFQRSIWQRLCNRGTIIVHQSNDEMPELRLSTFYAKDIFDQLKDAWIAARIATTVGNEGSQHHHYYDPDSH